MREIHLLPYHRLDMGKYEQLGLAYALADRASLTVADVSPLRDLLIEAGFVVKIGG